MTWNIMKSTGVPNTQKEFFLFTMPGLYMVGNHLSNELQARLIQYSCVCECLQRPEVGVGCLP